MPDPATIESLRQVGKGAKGSIRRGAPKFRANVEKPVSSIPSKFETILNPGNREQRGFGSQSLRFVEHEDENPGPGTYVAKRAPWLYDENTTSKANSCSRKGYGAMTSGHQRFRLGVNNRAYSGPGPSSYSSLSPGELTEAKRFNRAAHTSSFHSPCPKDKPLRNHEPDSDAPGPGRYEAQALVRTGNKVGWGNSPADSKSAFKGIERDMSFVGSADGAPVGTYNLMRSWSQRRNDNSAFAKGSSRGLTAGPGGQGPVGTAPPSIIYGEDAQAPAANGVPGPGQYETHEVISVHSKLAHRIEKHSSWSAPTLTDRFGRPLVPRVERGVQPGPGAYHEERTRAFASDAPAIRSSFISTTAQNEIIDEKALLSRPPGPAFYKPSRPGKKSYHLNARRRFIPIV